MVKEYLSKLPCALVWRDLSIAGSNLLIQTAFVPFLQEKHDNFQD